MNQHPSLYRHIIADTDEVNARIETMAAQIIEKFQGQDPLFVCLLRGGIPFAAKLMFAITKHDAHFFPELDYMTVSSYGDGQTPGMTRIIMDLSHKTRIEGRPVIVVDDLIDKGGTYTFTKKHLENKGSGQVYLATLVQRELVEPRGFDADFYCFSVSSPEWLVGMGMDDSRLGVDANRWAPWIATANPSE